MGEEKLIPTTMVGAYPRPKWYSQDMGDKDPIDALRDIGYREAFEDSVGLAVQDMDLAGLDSIPDPRQWYDGSHIESFFWYAPQRINGYKGWGTTPDILVKAVEANSVKKEFLDLVLEYHSFPNVVEKVTRGPLRMAEMYKIAQKFTKKPIRMPAPGCGPAHLALVTSGPGYDRIEDLAMDLAKIFNAEFKDCADAGAQQIQIDDLTLFLATVVGTDNIDWVVEALNRAFKGIDAKKTFHICFGTWWANIGFPGSRDGYGPIFEKMLDIKCDEFMLEFPPQGDRGWGADLKLFSEYSVDQDLAVGTYGPRSLVVESPDQQADKLRAALKHVDAGKLSLSSDCGMRIVPKAITRNQVKSSVEAAQIVRAELSGKG
jgi:5-methyltetrahydropteroyltriglutamate--homocysteine methyltransferase